MLKTRVWSLGDAVVDLLPLENNQYQACAGGAPANVAVALAKLGAKSGFIGCVGDDPFGHFLHKTLAGYQVDCQSLEFNKQYKTSTVVVDLNIHGDRSFAFLVSPSADQFLSTNALPDFDKDILHFCSLALVGEKCRTTLKEAISRLKQKGGLVSFDINLREQMWADKKQMRDSIEQFAQQAEILKLSDEELFWLTESNDWENALALLKNNYPNQLKVITKGDEGSIIISNEQQFTFPAYSIDCIDTTGAGDAFIAGLLYYITQNGMPDSQDSVTKMVSTASACGALATTQKGALTALPDKGYLDEFIAKNGQLKSF